MSILDGFPHNTKGESQTQVYEEHIDKSGTWAYFDGPCQGDPLVCGASIVMHLDNHNGIYFL